ESLNSMKQPLTRLAFSARAGYTLIEMAIVIAILGILAGFAIVSFGGSGETRDASMVQSAQASLQTLVSQGAVREDVRPDSLSSSAILTAIQANVNQIGSADQGISFASPGAKQFTMTIKNSGRSATFDISSNGDVRLIGLNKFQNYQVDNSNAIP